MRQVTTRQFRACARRLREHPMTDNKRRLAYLRRLLSRGVVIADLVGSVALLPVAWIRGSATRRRVSRLPPAKPPHHGFVPGVGPPIRVLAIGESSISGVGLSCGDETVAAVTARALTRVTGRPGAWRAYGLSGATVRDALERLLPRIVPEPVDILIIGFGVNDATAYRWPAAFADDLVALVTAARHRVGNAAVVIGGVAPWAPSRHSHGPFALSSAGVRRHCRRRPSS
jgi:hypothetical protein